MVAFSPKIKGLPLMSIERMKTICEYCAKVFNKSTGNYNRAKKLGLKLYCNKTCAGLGRRIERSDEEKREIKSNYDKQYRALNIDHKKKTAKEYFKRTYDPAKAAIHRKTRMPYHVEYCRKPEYKAKKKKYDQLHRAKINYGEFWESALLMQKIEKEIDDRSVRQINNLHNKSQLRKRKWQQLKKQNYLRVS